MWIERSVRLIILLALLVVLAGLLILALPDTRAGPELLQLDTALDLRLADFIGAGMVTVGIILIWGTMLAWQRKRIHKVADE